MRTPHTHVVVAVNQTNTYMIHALDPENESRTRCGGHINRGFYCVSLFEAGRRFPHALRCANCEAAEGIVER